MQTNERAPVAEFLGWLLFLTLLVEGILLLLEPYSVQFYFGLVLAASAALWIAAGRRAPEQPDGR